MEGKDQEKRTEMAGERPAFWRAWLMPLAVLVGMIVSLFAPDAAFAAQLPHGHALVAGSGTTPSGIPTVSYGTGNTTLGQTVNNSMENIAATIRYVLGGTALVVILAAAVMNHFVHDARAKERAKELIGAAVVGLLLAAFAPQIVNFIAGL